MPLGAVAAEQIQAEVDVVLKQLEEPEVRNLVVDFESVDYLTTDMLGVMQRFLRRVHALKGKMVLCNVSGAVHEVLRLVKLDTRWPIHSSRAQALNDVKG